MPSLPRGFVRGIRLRSIAISYLKPLLPQPLMALRRKWYLGTLLSLSCYSSTYGPFTRWDEKGVIRMTKVSSLLCGYNALQLPEFLTI